MQVTYALVRCGLTLPGEKNNDPEPNRKTKPTAVPSSLEPKSSRDLIPSFENPHSGVVKSFWNWIAHMGSLTRLDQRVGILEGKIKHRGDKPRRHAFRSGKFPAGYMSVAFKMDDSGTMFNIVAGSVAMKFTKTKRSPAAPEDTRQRNDPGGEFSDMKT